MKGSLQVKNGKYYAVLSYRENDKEVRKWISTGYTEKGNKRKAENALIDILHEYRNEDTFTNGRLSIEEKHKKKNDILFGEYLKKWLESRKNEIEELTYKHYSGNVCKISSFFNNRRIYLNDLKPYDLQEFYNYLYSKGCGGNTVVHYHVIIRNALQYAVRFELVDKNVADLINRPRKEKFQADFYNKDELKTLFDVIKGDPLELIIHIAVYYGLRRSEILGLKWSAINFKNKTIKINHKVINIKGKGLVGSNKMKNKSSNRILPLIPHIEKMFLEEKQKQIENKKLCNKNYNDKYSEYVCVNPLGDLYKPDYLTQHFAFIQQKNNLKHIRFHDLRHSCASLMLANKVPMKQIQEWLGHSSFQTTADIYSHLDFSSKIASANTISNALTFN